MIFLKNRCKNFPKLPRDFYNKKQRMQPWLLVVALLGLPNVGSAQSEPPAALAASVQQLRDAVGDWEMVTEFLNDDGSIAKTVNGTYSFAWVVVDKVLSGKSEIPELKMSSGILFYVSAAKQLIEMASVGADGNLWIMSGPLGSEVRYTQKYQGKDGREGQLRFTRFNVTAANFESKMEYTDDGGKTWKPGNHQVFRRK